MRPDEDIQEGFAFAIPDLYKPSSLAHFEDTVSVIEDLRPLSLLEEPQLELSVGRDPKSGLLEIPTFEYGPVDDVGVLEESSVASLETLDPPELAEEEDVWTSLQSSENDTRSTNLKSWEHFYGQTSLGAPTNLFLSEGGPKVYDAALIKSVGEVDLESVASTSGHVVQSQAILRSLKLLALGRESVVYYYDQHERSFRPRKSHVRMSGYSLQTYESLSARLQSQGKYFRELQDFVVETQRSSQACRAYFALAGAFVPILGSLESQVACPPTQVCSLLQLQALTERPGQVLKCLREVVLTVEGARTDEDLLSRLFELVRTYEHSPTWMLQILQGLLSSASRPWLDTVENWLGLRHQTYLGALNNVPAFTMARAVGVSGDASTNNDDLKFDPLMVPKFMSSEDAETIFETGKSLRLLEAHHLNHPLTRQPGLAEDESVKLDWHFTWSDIETVTAKAEAYESSLRKALKKLSSNSSVMDQKPQRKPESTLNSKPEQSKLSAQSFIENSTALFEQALPDISTSQPPYTDSHLDQPSTFAPPMSLLSTLSFKPITSACARLINHASLDLLLNTHHLRTHLSLLHRYVLMSDGVFTSRLSQALFSPHLSTAEWRPGHSRFGPSGLRLGHRDAWPPASSELRLALTGIIADSYFTSQSSAAERSIYSPGLPGDLSFAIRSMSADELKKCSDPNTLYALDFLRIQYTPTAPLDFVITQDSLEKYDCIFKLLLRCIRMLFVVTQLNFSPQQRSSTSATTSPRHSRKRDRHTAFRNESRHFVTTVCSHFFANIESHWQCLDRTLATLERTTNSDPGERPSKEEEATDTIATLPALLTFHSDLLSSLLLSLLLRKRQEQVMTLLEEIWGLVLRFAWLVNNNTESPAVEGGLDAEIGQLHKQFRRKVRVFVEVCRGIGQKQKGGSEIAGIGVGVGVGMEVLVGMFDMNGFYMRS